MLTTKRRFNQISKRRNKKFLPAHKPVLNMPFSHYMMLILLHIKTYRKCAFQLVVTLITPTHTQTCRENIFLSSFLCAKITKVLIKDFAPSTSSLYELLLSISSSHQGKSKESIHKCPHCFHVSISVKGKK